MLQTFIALLHVYRTDKVNVYYSAMSNVLEGKCEVAKTQKCLISKRDQAVVIHCGTPEQKQILRLTKPRAEAITQRGLN